MTNSLCAIYARIYNEPNDWMNPHWLLCSLALPPKQCLGAEAGGEHMLLGDLAF
jgi:hypothetical protein